MREILDDPNRIRPEHLLFFHFVPWDFELGAGRTVWNELVHRFHRGVNHVENMQEDWQSLESQIDPQRFEEVSHRLEQQVHDAAEYRDKWLERISTDAGRELPETGGTTVGS